jgi:hypothetical protein
LNSNPAADFEFEFVQSINLESMAMNEAPCHTTQVLDTACESIISNIHHPAAARRYVYSTHIAAARSHRLQQIPYDATSDSMLDAQRIPTQLQIEYANTASNCSSSLVHDREAAQTATIGGEEDTPVGARGNDRTVNIVTLHGIWRLTSTATNDSGDGDSTDLDVDDLFMIPVEESLIGQQSSLHELVID